MMEGTLSGYAIGKALAEIQLWVDELGKEFAAGYRDAMPKTRKLTFRERCMRAWSAFKVREA